MPGDITLKIDADTAAYIAKMSKLAAEHEKIGEAVKGHGGAMEKVGDAAVTVAQKVAGIAVPLSAIGAGIAAVTALWDAWRSSIDKTKEAIEKVHAVNQVIGRAGRGADMNDIKNATADGGLVNREDQAGFLKSYLAPEGIPNASNAQILQAASDAKLAKRSGFGTGEYTDVRRKLERSGVENPGDLALYYLQHVGDASEKALQATEKLPGQAEAIAKMGAAANGLGKKAVAMEGNFVEKWAAMGGEGSLTDFIKQQGNYFGGYDEPATYNALLRRMEQAPETSSATLKGSAGQLDSDPIERAMRERGRGLARADYARTTQGGFGFNQTLREIRAEGRTAEYDATTTGGRLTRGVLGLVADALPDALTNGSEMGAAHRATSGADDDTFDMVKDMRDMHARKILHNDAAGDE